MSEIARQNRDLQARIDLFNRASAERQEMLMHSDPFFRPYKDEDQDPSVASESA